MALLSPSVRSLLKVAFALTLPVAALAQVNPPVLTANQGLTVAQLEEKTITRTLLNATDLDPSGVPSDLADIEFVMDTRDPVTFSGTLRLYTIPGGRVLQPGDVVTLAHIRDGLLRYRANIADQLFDNILFRLRDIDGNYVRNPDTNAIVTFNFPITITQLNTRPTAVNGSATLGIGSVYEGALTAIDNDRPAQTLAFSVMTPPASGSVQILNAATGAFRYTAAPGVEGQVSFTFQVSDGLLNSATPGTFTLTMQNQPPVVADASFEIPQNRPFSATLSASDPDLPAQPLTFAVSTPPEKGTVTVSVDGTFRYTPAPGRFGEDSFRVTASDGRVTSAPAQVSFEIDHTPVVGDLFIATKSTSGSGDEPRFAMIAAIDPDQFDLSLSSAGGLLTSVRVLAYSRWSQKLYVVEGDPDESSAIVEIDPVTGAQRVVLTGEILQFSLGLAASDDGYLYIANAPLALFQPVDQSGPGSQVLRLDLRTGAHTVVLEDGPLHFPTGLALGNDGALYVADAEMFGLGHPDSPNDATILRLDLTTLNVTTFASGPLLQDPISLLPQSDGSFLVAELRGDIIKVDAQGTLSHVYDAVDGQRGVTGLTRDENGTIYATAFDVMENGGAQPAILRVLNPESATPTVEVFIEGDFLGEPFGIAAATEFPNLAAWQAAYFSVADRANPALEATVWGDHADPDGDGLSNLLEFALNLPPTKSDAGAAVLSPYLKLNNGADRLALTVSRRLGTDVTLTLEASSDLVTWETIGGPATTSAAGTTATFEDNTSLGATPARFIRLTVSRP